MPDNFDPFNDSFDTDVDPLTADIRALTILNKLKEGEAVVANLKTPEAKAKYGEDKAKLIRNLEAYDYHKRSRGEQPLEYALEAKARMKAESEDVVANKFVKLIKADDETFKSFLKEQGDLEKFEEAKSLMPPDQDFKPLYVKRKAMELFGFSEREISSGYAEPMFRKALGAGEHEPTEGAISRWGLATAHKYERRKKISSAAGEAAYRGYLGMVDSDEAFEKELSTASPDITNEERTFARAIRNRAREEMDKEIGADLRPVVQKLFNTVALEEGVQSKFEVEPFKDVDEAADALSKMPREKFPYALAMMAETAKAHGQDVDKFMNAMGRRLARGFGGVSDMIGAGAERKRAEFAQKAAEGKDLRIPAYLTKPEHVYLYLQHGGFIGASRNNPEMGEEMLKLKREAEKNMTGWQIAKGGDVRKVTKNDLDAIDTLAEQSKLAAAYKGEISNWREAVAKTESKRWSGYNPENLAYGLADSLPEMLLASTWVTLPFIAEAQKEKNMVDLRAQNPTGDWEKMEQGAGVAAAGYALLSRLQFTTLFKSNPSIKSAMGQFLTKMSIETATELAQDGMLPVTQKVYAAVNESMPDVNLGDEAVQLAESAPRIAFQMIPLVLMGQAGSKATQYMDKRQTRKLLQDETYLQNLTSDPDEIAKIKAMPLEDAANYVMENRSRFFSNMAEREAGVNEVTVDPMAQTNVQMVANPDGTFTVSNDTQVLTARSPEEAVEAAASLDPEAFKAPVVEAQVAGNAPEVVDVNEDRAADEPLIVDQQMRSRNASDPNVTVVHSFMLPFTADLAARASKESKFRVTEMLPPENDLTTKGARGQINRVAKWRYGLQTTLFRNKYPSKTLQQINLVAAREMAGVEAQFSQLAKALDDRVMRSVGKRAVASQDSNFLKMQSDIYYAMRGSDAHMKVLPKEVRSVVKQSRASIDLYSKKLVDSGFVTPELADKLGTNIGSYVTRQFKAHNPEAGWNYRTVMDEKPELVVAALRYFRGKGINGNEALGIIKEMLDPDQSSGAYFGTGQLGKANISNFIEKQDLAPEIIELLGEERNPAFNIKNTGTKVSKLSITYDAQAAMAEWMIANGIASRKVNNNERFYEKHRLGAENVPVQSIDKDGNEIRLSVTRTAKAYSGFGELYLKPEVFDAFKDVFAPKGKPSLSDALLDILASITAFGKFNQVILSPAAYPTNFLGGVAVEVFNGRVSVDGMKAYAKFGSFRNRGSEPDAPYGAVERAEVYEKTGAEWDAAGGVSRMSANFINSEMEIGGIRNVAVLARDFEEAIENMSVVSPESKIHLITHFFGKAYQAADNASKRNAFAVELAKWVKAEPNTKMNVLIQKAVEDVRMTTQNYDIVPQLLKHFSQRGVVVGTYISFSYELTRNTINTGRLAVREIASGNPVLAAAGMKRVAGMVAVGGALYALNHTLSQTLAGVTPEEEERLKANLEPWLENVVYLQADDKQLRYFDPSYLVPHQMFYNMGGAVINAAKSDKPDDTFKDAVDQIYNAFGGMNIMTETVSELVTNQKREGGEIYNEETDIQDGSHHRKMWDHFYTSVLKSGLQRSIEKVQDATAEEIKIKYGGAVPNIDDEFIKVVGIRPYTKDTSSEQYVVDNLKEFAFRNTDISMALSAGKRAKMTPDEVAKEEKKIESARKRLLREFEAQIGVFEVTDIPKGRVEAAFKDASVPKAFKQHFYENMDYNPKSRE
jgi:hypothetical protein